VRQFVPTVTLTIGIVDVKVAVTVGVSVCVGVSVGVGVSPDEPVLVAAGFVGALFCASIVAASAVIVASAPFDIAFSAPGSEQASVARINITGMTYSFFLEAISKMVRIGQTPKRSVTCGYDRRTMGDLGSVDPGERAERRWQRTPAS
jgi:hypothetical protein